MRITTGRTGRLLRFFSIALHVHLHFSAIGVVGIDLGQAFQLGQIFRIDLTVDLDQGAWLVIVIIFELIQVGKFTIHIENGGIHQRGKIIFRVNKLESAKISIEDFIKGWEVINIFYQSKAQKSPRCPATSHPAGPQGLNRIQALTGRHADTALTQSGDKTGNYPFHG